MRFLLALGVAVALTAGCGQKGPLYLRDKPPPGVRVPKPPVEKPVPYPEDPEKKQ
jgi:predicted small lipoprotein YifL